MKAKPDMQWNVREPCADQAKAPIGRWLRTCVNSLLIWLAAASNVPAQTTWEYSPYQICVWLATEKAPELTSPLCERIRRAVVTQSRLAAGSTWRVQVDTAPASVSDSIVTMPDLLTVDEVVKAEPSALDNDKVLLLGVRIHAGTYELFCREFDTATRTLGQTVRHSATQIKLVPYQAAAAVADAFSALVRIEQSRGKSGIVRVRAGGLVRNTNCPSHLQPNAVLQPIIRRNDRDGNPRPGGIQILDWTYLVVRGPETQDASPQESATKSDIAEPAAATRRSKTELDYLLHCEVYSAMRNPLTGRSSVRTQRLALAVRPHGDVTHLRLLSRDATPSPLKGYEIFAKKPLPKDSDIANKPARLGLTDWRGLIDITPDAFLLRIVYVKNGDHLIARLPIVPGYENQQSIQLPSDDQRLEAEAFVKGIENMVMDLVARRAILAARIRRRLKEKRIADARQLLAEIKTFRTRDDLEAMIASRQTTSLRSTDPREQQRIDQMLSGTRILLNKYLNPDKLVTLQREVEGE